MDTDLHFQLLLRAPQVLLQRMPAHDVRAQLPAGFLGLMEAGILLELCAGHRLLELPSFRQPVLFCLRQCRGQSLYNPNPKP